MAKTQADRPGKAIVTDTIVPSNTHAFKIGSRWYWVTEIVDTLDSGSQFVMTVPVARDPRYAQIGYGKVRYIQTGRESFMTRVQTPPRWDWVTRKLRETAAVDPELFARTAPRWNCVDYPGEGMHYRPGTGPCAWCGK